MIDILILVAGSVGLAALAVWGFFFGVVMTEAVYLVVSSVFERSRSDEK